MEMTDEEAQALAAQLSHPQGEEGIAVGQRMFSANINMIRESAAALHLKPGQTLIEIGHGNGAHVREILEKYRPLSYTGLEVSRTMHEQARQENSDLHRSLAQFHLYDGHSIPLEDESADAVLAVNSIYFWNNPSGLIKEFRRILRPRGVVAIGLGEKEFMETLPVVKHGFRTYNRAELMEITAGTGMELGDLQNFTETVESNLGTTMERKFQVAILKPG